MGLGHAIWCARKFIGDEPFGVLLGDDIIKSDIPGLKQLINQFEKTGSSVLGVQEVNEEDVHKYGVIDPVSIESNLIKVKSFIEKPSREEAPSNLAIIGRYILTPEIFSFLDEKKVGNGGEIQLTDAIEQLNTIQNVYAFKFEGKRFDVGDKLGFIETTLAFALERPELKRGVLEMMERFTSETK